MAEPAGSKRGYRNTLWWRLYDWSAQAADRRFGWDKLPKPIGLLVLVGLRNTLRQRNLYDTAGLPSAVTPKVPKPTPETLTTRTPLHLRSWKRQRGSSIPVYLGSCSLSS